jgi:hypothetical protein
MRRTIATMRKTARRRPTSHQIHIPAIIPFIMSRIPQPPDDCGAGLMRRVAHSVQRGCPHLRAGDGLRRLTGAIRIHGRMRIAPLRTTSAISTSQIGSAWLDLESVRFVTPPQRGNRYAGVGAPRSRSRSLRHPLPLRLLQATRRTDSFAHDRLRLQFMATSEPRQRRPPALRASVAAGVSDRR